MLIQAAGKRVDTVTLLPWSRDQMLYDPIPIHLRHLIAATISVLKELCNIRPAAEVIATNMPLDLREFD